MVLDMQGEGQSKQAHLFWGSADIGGQFRIRIGASDSFECVTANQIWGSSQHLGKTACLIGTRAFKLTHRS